MPHALTRFAHIDHADTSLCLQVTHEEPMLLSIRNVRTGESEALVLRDRVLELDLSSTHLIVVTASQCLVYTTPKQKLHAPRAAVELNGVRIAFVLQCASHFVLADNSHGLRVLDFDGRLLSQPRFEGMQVERLAGTSLPCVPHRHARPPFCVYMYISPDASSSQRLAPRSLETRLRLLTAPIGESSASSRQR